MKKLFLSLLLFVYAHIIHAQISAPPQLKPFTIGEIAEIDSKILGEKRLLNIYLPDGYSKNDTIKYPVIYLLDGSADEDFIHVAGIVQFANFSWVNFLPKSIVVGIANIDRRKDFTFPTTIQKDKKDFPTTGGSQNFISFIEKELQPFVEKNYNTNAIKTIIGQSLGGLLATEILFVKPQLFTNYLIVSPSLWWDNESLLKRISVAEKDFKSKRSIYIATGKEGKRMEDDAKKLFLIIKNRRKNDLVTIELLRNENHASILHNAVYSGFEKMNHKRQH
jgi:uncharacterized protein